MTTAGAAEFPAKPVRLVIPFAAGGSNDLTARAFAQPLSRALGQSVVIDNRPGASGIVAAELVARAPADGHTLLIGGAGFLITSVTHPKPPYDVQKDFAFVARITSNTWIICVHPSLPVRNIRELIALARAHPGELAYASAGTGSGQHLSGEMLKLMAKIDIIHIPFQGSAPASIAAIGGHTGILIADMASIVQPVAAGKLRPLAVTTRTRSPQLPAIPSVAESGLPDFELNSFVGVEAPAATPRDVVTRLSAEFVRVAGLPDVKDNLFKLGAQAAPLNTDEFDAFFRAEIQKIRKLVKEANIKLE
jgi:tripartite-type tricarboxylate transporter receptor subunit TctC